MDWIIPEKSVEREQKEPDNLRLSVLISLLLHGMLAAIIVTLGIFNVDQPDVTPSVVRINLIPAELLLRAEPPEQIDEFITAETTNLEQVVEEVDDVVIPEATEQFEEIQPSTRSEPPIENLVEINLPEVEGPVPTQSTEAQGRETEVISPTRMALQRVIRSLSEQDSSKSWNTNCDALQRQNELINCEEQTEPDFSILESSLANRLFSTTPQSDSARVAQRFIGGNSGELAARLNSMDLGGVTSDYLINEIEAGISIYSSNGNVRLERLEDQANANDPAYQQMRRVMGRP